MGNSTARPDLRKPHPDFPLTPRGDGRWQKKVRGQTYYFTGTAQVVLEEWLRVKDDLLAGRVPRPKDDSTTIVEICDRFLVAKREQVEAGELKLLSWNDYKATCDRIVAQFGKTRSILDLRTEDFEKLKSKIAKTRGIVATGNEIQRVRVVFNYAFDAGLIDHQMRFGPHFKRPSKKTLRKVRAAGPKKLFASEELRHLIGIAGPAMRAMILLAINCGMGNSDVGNLPIRAIDLKAGWLDFPRPKTGCQRRCPLWRETVEAIEACLANRPTAKTEHAQSLLFLTRCGEPWAKDDRFDNPVTKEFRKLLGKLKLHQPRCGFYWLRHTFRTIAGAAKDQPAANLIMGHSDGSMSESYTEEIDDARLLAIVRHVHSWLFPPATDGMKQAGNKQHSYGKADDDPTD